MQIGPAGVVLRDIGRIERERKPDIGVLEAVRNAHRVPGKDAGKGVFFGSEEEKFFFLQGIRLVEKGCVRTGLGFHRVCPVGGEVCGHAGDPGGFHPHGLVCNASRNGEREHYACP